MKHNRNNEKFSSPAEGVELSLLFRWEDIHLYRYTQKMRVVPGNPFSNCDSSQALQPGWKWKSCTWCVCTGKAGTSRPDRRVGFWRRDADPQQELGEQEAVQHPCASHELQAQDPSGPCSPWVIYFSISKHPEAVRSTSQARCGCVGILAQNPC